MRLLTWLLWWSGVLFLTLGGLPTGWLPTHLERFRTIGPNQHLVAAGAYAAAGIVLCAGTIALAAFDSPPNARRLVLACAALFYFLAVRATFTVSNGPLSADALWQGASRVLFTPWALFHLTVGAIGWARIVRENRRQARPDASRPV